MDDSPNADNTSEPTNPGSAEPIPTQPFESAGLQPTPIEPKRSELTYYAPMYPRRQDLPVEQLSYARPGTYRHAQQGYPAVMFILGMMAPWVAGCLLFSGGGSGGAGSLVVVVLLLFLPPLVMLLSKSTRMLGAGWITSLALTFLILLALCGGAFR